MITSQPAATEPAKIPFARSQVVPEAIEEVSRVLSSGWLTTGPEVASFESDFADYVGAPHGIAVSSCTAALELALRALQLPRGAKVLTSTMTFCGAVHAIVHAGLTPVLVDVNAQTLMPDVETTELAVWREGKVDAMVALHFAGQPAPVEEMAAAAGLPMSRVIEDAAHALGTAVGNQPVGTVSAATCFSFYATKNLPVGEGGMVTTADPQIEEHIRRARLHGMSRDAWKRYAPGASWRYEIDRAGLKANMTDVQAAIGRAHLRHFDGWQQRRAELAERYDERLWSIPGIRLPSRPARGRHAWHVYVIRVEERNFGVSRDALCAELSERGIGSSVHFIPLHHQSYFLQLLGREIAGAFPNADAVFPQILSLPLHQHLGDEDIDRICDELKDIHAASVQPSQWAD